MNETITPAFPRVKGRVGQIEGTNEWLYELTILIGPNVDPIELQSKERWNTPDEAAFQMRVAIPEILKPICEKMGLDEPVGVLDLKSNKTIEFDKFKKDGTDDMPGVRH